MTFSNVSGIGFGSGGNASMSFLRRLSSFAFVDIRLWVTLPWQVAHYLAPQGGSLMAIAGMVLGIVAIVFAFVPIMGAFISFPCIVVGLPLAIVGFLRNRKAGLGTGMAIAGIATNAVALLIVIIWLAVVGAVLSEFSHEIDTENGASFGTGDITVPAFGGIDRSVKDNVGMMGARPTDGEIRRACQALHSAGWNYMSMGMNTDMRSTMIAASITMFASGQELLDYCDGKMVVAQESPFCTNSEYQYAFSGAVFESYPSASKVLLDTFQMTTGTSDNAGEYKIQMDFIAKDESGNEETLTAYGTMNASDCSVIGFLVK